MAKNKKWSSAAKFEIALQAIKNDTPLNEICKKYDVSPSQVHAWKKQLLEEGMQPFNKADKTSKLIAEHEEKQRVLYALIRFMRQYDMLMLQKTHLIVAFLSRVTFESANQ